MSFIIENFELLSERPEHVRELKKLVLELAIRGKLINQNLSDEPASVLLEKIRTEKKKLVEEGKIKKPKKLIPINESNIPFELPENWAWCRLEEITELITKGSSPKWQGVEYTDKSNGILFITSKNVGNNKIRLKNLQYVESKFNDIEPRSILKKGDILMNIVGASIGRTAQYDLDEIANINQAVCLIRFLPFVELSYFLNFFNRANEKSFL